MRFRWRKCLPGKALEYLIDILPSFAWEGITISQRHPTAFCLRRHYNASTASPARIGQFTLFLANYIASHWKQGFRNVNLGLQKLVKTHSRDCLNALVCKAPSKYIFGLTISDPSHIDAIKCLKLPSRCLWAYSQRRAKIFFYLFIVLS